MSLDPSALNSARRQRDLDWLTSGGAVDVLVVGGGITGAGAALDAAQRGLSVALVERGDLAQGTSGMSSKLIHGGLRYLAGGGVAIARECARERHLLMTRIAPHLVRRVPLVWPLTPAVAPIDALILRTALRAGDALRVSAGTRSSLLPRSRRIDAATTQALLPAVRSDALRGGLLYWDGLVEDDARLVVTIARTAAAHGARIVTYCAAERVGPINRLVDRTTGHALDLRARAVINATGVWTGDLVPGASVRASKGSHLVLRAAALGHPRAALQVPIPGERARTVFAVPRPDDTVLVGLTEDEVNERAEQPPTVTISEEHFLLDVLGSGLGSPLGPDAVVGRFAGLRPLVDAGGASTADLSRRHAIVVFGDEPIVSVLGGKLTTYRRMAEQAVDRAVDVAGLRCPASLTARTPLVTTAPLPARKEDLAPLEPGLPVSRADVRFAFSHEGALGVEDVVARRITGRLVDEVRDARAAIEPSDLLAEAIAG